MQPEGLHGTLDGNHSMAQIVLEKLSQLNELANRLRDSFRLDTSRPEMLEQAIKALRMGLSLHPPGTDRSAFLNDLAGALWERYSRSSDLDDLNESIQILRDALTHCPLGHPLRAETLNNLAICLHSRYKEQRSSDDLNEAIKTQEAALVLRPEGHPDRSSSLSNLALCLRDRFHERGSPDDLDHAVAYNRAALALRSEGHPLRPSCLCNLGVVLQYRYQLRDGPEDLMESIQLLRAALSSYPPRHHERSMVQYNLCLSLHHKFRRDGTIDDLNEAIDLLRPLQERQSFRHTVALSYFSTFASCLKERFLHLGAPMDLDAAILYHSIVIEICPIDHSERSAFLNNLGNDFEERFSLHGSFSDLEKAIKRHQAALDLRPPGHADRSSSLNNLGSCYKQKFKSLGELEDLNKAIQLTQAALELRPEGHVLRPSTLGNLAECFSVQFKASGTSSDLTTAIDLFRSELSLQQVGHPGRSQALWYLAYNLLCRFEHCEGTEDLDEAFQLYSELSEPKEVVSHRDFQAAVGWAKSAEKFNHVSAMEAYQTALTFLVRHATIFPPSVAQYQILKKNASSLAADAFSYCVRHGNIKSAVELLEQGRTVFWTQLARLGTPLDELSSSGPETTDLAEEFQRISTRLRALFDEASEFQSTQTQNLIAKLNDVISRIRTTPGFARFLSPPEFSDLQTTAKDGPIIIMNASQYTCDAVIILHKKDPVHIKLGAPKAHFSALAARFRRVVDKPKLVTDKEIGIFLRDLWGYVVEPIVKALQEHGIAPDSRIWWCPTGDFTFLPFHAAGPFRRGQPNLIDLYISSYTPTLGTLLRARKQARPPAESPPFAVVGASEPHGETPLPSVTSELALVADRVQAHADVTLLANKDATVARAADTFARCAWLHLACHGIPDKAQPFASAFALHDGRLTIGRLVQTQGLARDNGSGGDHEAGAPSPGSEFAFLSACRTTVGDAGAPDEVVHLAAAMQFGGFRSVVGTVLPVEDAVAGRVVGEFYDRLLGGPSARLDCSAAAVALHGALKALRGKIPFDQQIVFVHLGV